MTHSTVSPEQPAAPMERSENSVTPSSGDSASSRSRTGLRRRPDRKDEGACRRPRSSTYVRRSGLARLDSPVPVDGDADRPGPPVLAGNGLATASADRRAAGPVGLHLG